MWVFSALTNSRREYSKLFKDLLIDNLDRPRFLTSFLTLIVLLLPDPKPGRRAAARSVLTELAAAG